MAVRKYSTGLPNLDVYVGGIAPSDSLLLLSGDLRDPMRIIAPAIRYSHSANIQALYLSANDSLLSHFQGHPKLQHRCFTRTKLRPQQLLQSVMRFASAHCRNSFIFLDDVSAWVAPLGSEKRVLEFVDAILGLVRRKQSVLLFSALRTVLNHESLVHLKDSVSICLDLISHHNETYCVPLALKGRYIPYGILPLRMRKVEASTLIKLEQETPQEQSMDRQLAQLEPLASVFDNRFEKLFGETAEAMILFDVAGDYREINKRAEDLTGYSNEELKLMNPLSIVSQDDRRKALRLIHDLKRGRRASVRLTIVKRNGKPIPIELSASKLHQSYFVGIARDMTEQQKLEAIQRRREDEYRSIIHEMPFALCIVRENDIVYVNHAFNTLFVYTDGAATGKPLRALFGQESIRQYQKIVRLTSGNVRTFDAVCLRSDGSSLQCQVSVSDVHFQGKRSNQLLFVDITAQKQLLQNLTESEQRYRSAVENSPDAVALIRGVRLEYVNTAFRTMFGVEADQNILDQPVTLGVDPADHQRVLDFFQKLSGKKGGPSTQNFTALRIDGKRLNAEVLVVPIRENGAGLLLGYYSDVTTIVTARHDLHRRDEEMRFLSEIMPTLQSSLDVRKLVHGSLHKISDVLGWGVGAAYLADQDQKTLTLVERKNLPDAILGKLTTLPLNEGIGGFLSKTLEPHVFTVDRYPSYLPHRSVFRELALKEICFLPLIAKGGLVGMLFLGSKTEGASQEQSTDLFSTIGRNLGSAVANAQAFSELRSSEERLHTLVESSPAVCYVASPNGSFTLVSRRVDDIVGYTPREFYRTPALWLRLVFPDDKKILLERITNVDTLPETSAYEYRVLPKGKASYRWVRDTVTVKKDEGGRVVNIFGTVEDITEQKRLLDEMCEENTWKTNLLASVSEGVVAFDRTLKCTVWNSVLERMTGLKESDVLGKHANDVLLSPENDGVHRLLGRALDGEIVSSADVPYRNAAGNEATYLWGRYAPLRTTSGEIMGVIGIISDVSGRKQIERELQESAQVLRNVIDTMGDILVITDFRGRVLQVNRAFVQILGYSRADAVGHEFPYPWLIEEEMGRFVLWVANLRERTWLHDFDMTWRANDGHLISMSLSTTLLRNSYGEPIAMLNIARNISERVRMRKELESRHRQIELINRIISKANQTMDFEEVFGAIAKEFNAIVPADLVAVGLLSPDGQSLVVHALLEGRTYVKERTLPIDQSISQYIIQTLEPVIVSDFLAGKRYQSFTSLHKGLRSQISLPIILKGKIFGTLNVGSKEPHQFSEDLVPVFQPIAQQVGAIIDRIQLFNKVAEDASYIHNLLDSIDSIVYTVNTEFRIREVNKAWFEFMRELGSAVLTDYSGRKLFDVLPSESLKVTYQNVADQLINGAIRIFSQEFVHRTRSGERIYQLTINPMVIDRRVTGLVFTHTDITALKQTEAELKKSNEQLLALNEISTLINTSLDLRQLLTSATPLLQKTLETSAVIVYLQEGSDLVLAEQVGFDPKESPSIGKLRQVSSATGEVVSTKRALYVAQHAYLDERIVPQNREILRRMHCEAMAIVPLISQDRVLGALDIFYTEPHEFTEQEQQVLSLVGSQLGAAIENARLYGELRSQIDRLTVLYELSQQLTSTLSIDQIFQSVHEQVHRIAPYRRFTIDTYDAIARTLTPAFCVDVVNGEMVFSPTPAQPILFDPAVPEGSVVSMKRSYRSDDQRRVLIPMLSKETIIGIMTVEAGADLVYTDTHVQILESIANLTAIALEKGKLYEETVQKSIEIQRQNKELDDFTYVVSHDLKEPLISIEGYSRILQLDYQDIIQAEGKEYLTSIVGATTRMKGLIDDLLQLSRISRPSEAFKPVAISDVLKDIQTEMEYTIKHRGVQFVVPEALPVVHANGAQVKILFRNLIGNAIKFNDKPNPTVTIEFQNAENNSYLFSVSDNGIGIDREFYEKIFIIFQRLHPREEYEGSGAGLAIVKKIIEQHQGKIWVVSEVGKGSTFFFTLPKFAARE